MIELDMFERLLMLFYNRTEMVYKRNYPYLNGESFDNLEGGILNESCFRNWWKTILC